MTHYTLGIDVGTYETKGVIVDAAGTVVAQAARGHRMRVPQPGWAEHRPDEDWWGDVTHVSRSVIASSGIDPKRIAGVGCSAIGPCMLPVDADGRPLRDAVLYGVDTRAAREIADLDAAIGRERILDRCGNALTSQSVGPKILWLQRNESEHYAAAAHIVSATTFIVRRLTGRTVIDHYSASSFSPLYDAERLDWDVDFAPGIVRREQLPDLAWTCDIAGRVTDAAAAETGLAAGTPVIVGTIDAASEAISVGVNAPGQMMIMYGSTIFIILVTAARVRDARLWYAPWLFPGQHASMSGAATSGTLTHWFRDQFARDLDPATAHAALAAEAAAAPPGAKGLVVLPYFSGERTPIHDPLAKGCIFGLDLTHTRADVYRALLEGIAFGVNQIIEAYAQAGVPPAEVFAVGGGTRNAVWRQAVSDIGGIEQRLRRQTIGASYGNAFLAALAVGAAAPGDIDRWNPDADRVTPDRSLAALYAERARIFKALYEDTRGLMAALSTAGNT